MIGTITYFTSWNARYMNGRAYYGVETSRESRQEASLPIIHPLSISPRYRAIFSTLSQVSVVLWFVVGDCLVDTTQARVDRCWAPVTSNPSLGGHRLRPFLHEFNLPSIHPTGVSCYGARDIQSSLNFTSWNARYDRYWVGTSVYVGVDWS